MESSTQSAANIERETAHSRAVREMFSGIAGKYDLAQPPSLAEHRQTAGGEKSGPRSHDILGRENAAVLDVACGTGDLSIELKR